MLLAMGSFPQCLQYSVIHTRRASGYRGYVAIRPTKCSLSL